MSRLSKYFALLALALCGSVSTAALGQDFLPKNPLLSHYEGIWKQSPFHRNTVKGAAPVAKAPPSTLGIDFALAGISKVDGVTSVILFERATGKFLRIAEDDEESEVTIVEILDLDDRKNTRVKVARGEHTAEIKYDGALVAGQSNSFATPSQPKPILDLAQLQVTKTPNQPANNSAEKPPRRRASTASIIPPNGAPSTAGGLPPSPSSPQVSLPPSTLGLPAPTGIGLSPQPLSTASPNPPTSPPQTANTANAANQNSSTERPPAAPTRQTRRGNLIPRPSQ